MCLSFYFENNKIYIKGVITMEDKNYYEILGVSSSASVDEIEEAFNRLADSLDNASEEYKEARDAFLELSDDKSRERYNFALMYTTRANINYYELLGVNQDATEEELKLAFRKVSKEYHPDIRKAPIYVTLFAIINKAREILNDPNEREVYNNSLAARGQSPHRGSIYSDLFSDAHQSADYDRGEDLRQTIRISFLDSIYGVTKELEIKDQHKCKPCDGTGKVEKSVAIGVCPTCNGTRKIIKEITNPFGVVTKSERTCPQCRDVLYHSSTCDECHGIGQIVDSYILPVEIPAGVSHDEIIKFKELGKAGKPGKPNGDLMLKVRVSPSTIEGLERAKRDLLLNYKAKLSQLIEGDKVQFEVGDRLLEFIIQPNSKVNDTITVVGQGVRDSKRGARGNFIITLDLEIPELTHEQLQLLKSIGM